MVAERYCRLPRPVMPPPTLERLTPAEHEVLSHVCAGYSNRPSPGRWTTGKEIAALLSKAEPTVKHPPSQGFGAASQVSACLRKFGLSSRMRLMAALR